MKKLICMILLAALLLCTACGTEEEHQQTETESTQMVVEVDSSWEIKTVDDLIRRSSLIVYGTVMAKSHAFQVEGVGGERGIYTDCEFTVSDRYRGELAEASITVRVHGGVFGGISEVHNQGAKLEMGEDYLLLLYQPRYGITHTAGDYYYVLDMAQGAFSRQEDGSYLSQYGTELTEETLVSLATEFPVDPDLGRKEYMENLKKKLESGTITQEEYDEWMAQMDEYAIIITEENS